MAREDPVASSGLAIAPLRGQGLLAHRLRVAVVHVGRKALLRVGGKSTIDFIEWGSGNTGLVGLLKVMQERLALVAGEFRVFRVKSVANGHDPEKDPHLRRIAGSRLGPRRAMFAP